MDAPELAAIVDDPERVELVPGDPLPALLGKLEELEAMLWHRLATPEEVRESEPQGPKEDRLLTVSEVAELLNLEDDGVYRRAKEWPFTRRLGPNTLRFSQIGLHEWLDGR